MRTLSLLLAPALLTLGTQATAQTVKIEKHQPARIYQKLYFELYGIDDTRAAQSLKVELCGPVEGDVDEAHGLKITGMQAGDPLLMVAGFSPVEIDLPWKDTLLVEPMIVAWIGNLDKSRAFYLPFNIRTLALCGGALHLQFFEMLAIEPYPLRAASSPGVRIGVATG